MSVLSDRIKAMRIQRELTQKALAEKLECSESAVRMWELGKNEPSIEMIEDLATELNTTPGYLIGWKDDPINYNDDDLIASIPLSYLKACGGDVERAYKAMQAVDDDVANEYRASKIIELRPSTEESLRIALFGGDGEVTDEMRQEAKFAAQKIKERYKRYGGQNKE